MAIDSFASFTNTNGVIFPDNEAVNASGGAATDGTEFVKLMIDNYMFGRQQALLDHAGLSPSGSSEAAGASQEIEALQKGMLGQPPGSLIGWLQNDDPATYGARCLLLTGQGILRANFADLDNAVYVGDSNNPTAPAFYHADDAAGTIRNTTGVYLILPDARAMFWRGTGTHGTLQMADGNYYAGPTNVGGSELDQIFGHYHNIQQQTFPSGVSSAQNTERIWTVQLSGTASADSTEARAREMVTDGTNGTPRDGDETRPVNLGIRWAISY